MQCKVLCASYDHMSCARAQLSKKLICYPSSRLIFANTVGQTSAFILTLCVICTVMYFSAKCSDIEQRKTHLKYMQCLSSSTEEGDLHQFVLLYSDLVHNSDVVHKCSTIHQMPCIEAQHKPVLTG